MTRATFLIVCPSAGEVSWFASFVTSTQMLGNLVAVVLTERFGRRRCMVGAAIMIVLGCLLLYSSVNYAMVMVSCILCSSSIGLLRPSGYLLLSEVCLIRYRGALGCTNSLILNLGYLYGLLIGPLMPITYLPFLLMGPCVLFLVLSPLLVESPLWYMRMDRDREARTVLQGLRLHV